MNDPLLSSLCGICRINIPKYVCPRCSLQTCSLPCSRRHKLWASCSGVRDPTVFKPRAQLATPSGVDQDYNFLHSIEHQIERSEKRIVEDRGLVDKQELAAARRNEDPEEWQVKLRKRKRQTPGHEPIVRALKMMRTTVVLAPQGMKRSLDNDTSWARRQRVIFWQVEWIREGHAGSSLSKVLADKPIGVAFSECLEEERTNTMSEKERRVEKKQSQRKAKEVVREARESFVKGPRFSTSPILQDPQTGAWSSTSVTLEVQAPQAPAADSRLSYHLYLLRPQTPSSFPRVLTPLKPTKSLQAILRRRLVLEFPTIYVLQSGPRHLPNDFMLEKDFLSATHQPPWPTSDIETSESSEEDSSSEEESGVSGTSSSGPDSDDELEDGELSS